MNYMNKLMKEEYVKNMIFNSGSREPLYPNATEVGHKS